MGPNSGSNNNSLLFMCFPRFFSISYRKRAIYRSCYYRMSKIRASETKRKDVRMLEKLLAKAEGRDSMDLFEMGEGYYYVKH